MKKKIILILMLIIVAVASGITSYSITKNSNKDVVAIVSGNTTKPSDKNANSSNDVNKVTYGSIRRYIVPLFNDKLSNIKVNLTSSKAKASYSLKDVGFKYDVEKLVELIYDYGNKNNKLDDDKELYTSYIKNNKILPSLSEADYDIFFNKISDKFNILGQKPAVSFNGNSVSLTGGSSRYMINKTKLYTSLKNTINNISTENNINIDIPYNEISYKVDKNLSKKMSLLSTFSTQVPEVNTGRTKNIQIFLSKINRSIIFPGETFSCDQTAGRRELQDGYCAAPSFVNNKVVDLVAGGICQGVTTIYNSALYADLQIVERTPHSLPVSYIGLGRDATIAHGSIDLKLRNNKKYPIIIQSYVTNSGQVTANIWGVNEEPNKKIELIVESLGPKKTRTYKKTYNNGQLVRTDIISTDTYK